MKFDKVSFYPDTSAANLENSFNFVAGLTDITEHEKELNRHCCKSVLFQEGVPW